VGVLQRDDFFFDNTLLVNGAPDCVDVLHGACAKECICGCDATKDRRANNENRNKDKLGKKLGRKKRNYFKKKEREMSQISYKYY